MAGSHNDIGEQHDKINVSHYFEKTDIGIMLPDWAVHGLEFLTTLFIFSVGLAVLAIFIIFILDISQTKNAIRRNYPVIGRFRSLFTKLGEFFRQYFFAMDREEMPFNRAEREWVYRASGNKNNTIAFGSTKNLNIVGTPIFVNCPFPQLEDNFNHEEVIEIGPYCKNPYYTSSVFNISGMSFGSLSSPAIRSLSKGAKIAGCWLNTGEGGLSPYHLEGGCDIIFQIGTAKYGVRNPDGTLNDKKLKKIAAKSAVKMFEIKLSQGAKPGKGGILPAKKVTAEIAEIRNIPFGEASISPNRHPEISSVSELLDFIDHVRTITNKPVGFKTVIGNSKWIEELCQEVISRGIEKAPDFITIDGGDGGTGAAPMALMDNVGLTLKESLPMVSDILSSYDLKERVRIIASGKLITPAEVAWALCSGADFVNSARGFMFAMGCIQSLKCNKNTCPTGIATQNTRLQTGLNPEDKAVKVANYHRNMIREVEIIAHSCGANKLRYLQRHHVRLVGGNVFSKPMDKIFPSTELTNKTQKGGE